MIAAVLATLPALAQDSNDTAWFLGSQRTVHYCIDRAPDFSVNHNDLQAIVKWALDSWVYKMNSIQDLQNRPEELKVAHLYVETSNCASADLKILFGVTSEKIEDFKRREFFHPLGFTMREQSDLLSGWSKGLIWIAHDNEFRWASRPQLKGVLLHEIGHVFGVGHARGTIMEQDLVGLVTRADIFKLTHIEHEHQLLSSQHLIWQQGGDYSEIGELSEEAFVHLIGRGSRGIIFVSWNSSLQQMIVRDDLSQSVLQARFFYEKKSEPNPSAALFLTKKENVDGSLLVANGVFEASVQIGELSTQAGQQISIIVEQNLAARHLNFKYLVPNSTGIYVDLLHQPCEWTDVPLIGSRCLPVYPGDEG